MKIVKFTNGYHSFWVSNPKKLKYWRGLIGIPHSSVKELKSIEK